MKEFLFGSQTILSRNRFPWVDYARGICIILVCYRHVFEGLSNVSIGTHNYPLLKYFNIFFFSFRMPLFFIVSGIFLGSSLMRKGVGEYVSSRFNSIFYPLIIWGSIQITLQLLFAGYVNAERTPMDYLYLITDPRKIEQFWYLNALFFVGVLYALIRVFLKVKSWQNLVLGIGFYVVAALCKFNNVQIGFLLDVLFFYLFFAIGDLIADLILNPGNYKFLSSARLFLLMLPLFGFMQHYFTRINLEANDDYYVQYHLPALYAFTALIGGIFIINISFILQKLNILRFLRVVGYHSLYIYVMHLLVTAAIRIVMVKILGIENIPLLMLLSIVFGIVIPIIFYNVANRLGAWWLFSLKKSKLSTISPQTMYLPKGVLTPKESVEEKDFVQTKDNRR